jgi:hypothetical protein
MFVDGVAETGCDITGVVVDENVTAFEKIFDCVNVLA